MRIDRYGRSLKGNHSRIRVIIIWIAILACILIVRLVFLQVIFYREYESLSLKNHLLVRPIWPKRGNIYDRHYRLLAGHKMVYQLVVCPDKVRGDLRNLIDHLPLITPVTQMENDLFFKHLKYTKPYECTLLRLSMPEEEMAYFAVRQNRFPGFSLRTSLKRYYPFEYILSPVLGYLGAGREIPNTLPFSKGRLMLTPFKTGISGLECYYDTLLSGSMGYQVKAMNAQGRLVRILEEHRPDVGYNLVLTLDVDLQKLAYKALQGQKGAVVLVDVHTGGILALVTRPSMRVPGFQESTVYDSSQKFFGDDDSFNRATQGLYPPGSILKPFIALMALSQKYIRSDESIWDPGYFIPQGSTHIFHDWKKEGHGYVNLKKALIVSCDTYFYTLATRMGIKPMLSILRDFSFGEVPTIDFPRDQLALGVLNSPAWKSRHQFQDWYIGDTIISSIGQGNMLVSPLQSAYAIGKFATYGRMPHLHFLESYYHQPMLYPERLHFTKHVQTEKPLSFKIQSYDWQVIHEALYGAVSSHMLSRTAWRLSDLPFSVAGKTGTSQVVAHQNEEEEKEGPTHSHSWFIGFAPAKNPSVAIAVLVEHANTATSIAKRVLRKYCALYHCREKNAALPH